MDLRKILLVNLKTKYGNLVNASRELMISSYILQNWAESKSQPNLNHLDTISRSSRINASFWIQENFFNLPPTTEFSQLESLHYYFQENIHEQMTNSGKRRRDLYKYYYDGNDIMSPDTFDDYRFGKVQAIPLYRLEELSTFLKCPIYKLIEVKEIEKER